MSTVDIFSLFRYNESMSYYEQFADGKEYFHFQRREAEVSAHFHSAIEFLFVEKGEQLVTLGGETRLLKSGEACFADSFCLHAYKYEKGNVCHVVVGDKSYFEKQFSRRASMRPPRFFRFDDFALLNDLRLRLEKPFHDENNKKATFEGAMCLLLAEIGERVPFVKAEKDLQGELVCDILSYAEREPESDLSLRALAKKYGYSHEHLSRVLHKYLAENWNSFVSRIRLKKAKTLLEERKDKSVLSIAYECGFESPNTFYRAYKREYGTLPRRK